MCVYAHTAVGELEAAVSPYFGVTNGWAQYVTKALRHLMSLNKQMTLVKVGTWLLSPEARLSTEVTLRCGWLSAVVAVLSDCLTQ